MSSLGLGSVILCEEKLVMVINNMPNFSELCNVVVFVYTIV